MAIERIYREAMKLDHFCDGGGDVFGRNQQSLVVGFDMEWKVLYKKGGGEAKSEFTTDGVFNHRRFNEVVVENENEKCGRFDTTRETFEV